ncbi:MAG: ABC transporter permease [Baekduiaceae bacterium]
MGRFIIRRLVGMVIVLFAVSVIVFAIFNMIPNGAPENRMAGKQSTPQQIEAIRREWGFDKPVYTQYAKMMEKLATGDLVSYQQQRNVFDEIKQGLPHTFSLAIGAAILWMAAGVALGVYSASRAGGKADFAVNVLALIGISVPVFWLGALVNYYLGYKLGWFPNGGYVEVAEGGLWQWAYHLFMPWTVLALLFIGVYSRVLRGTILETQNEDFVRTARAKGLSEKQVMRRHVLRTSMIPINEIEVVFFKTPNPSKLCNFLQLHKRIDFNLVSFTKPLQLFTKAVFTFKSSKVSNDDTGVKSFSA